MISHDSGKDNDRVDLFTQSSSILLELIDPSWCWGGAGADVVALVDDVVEDEVMLELIEFVDVELEDDEAAAAAPLQLLRLLLLSPLTDWREGTTWW